MFCFSNSNGMWQKEAGGGGEGVVVTVGPRGWGEGGGRFPRLATGLQSTLFREGGGMFFCVSWGSRAECGAFASGKRRTSFWIRFVCSEDGGEDVQGGRKKK